MRFLSPKLTLVRQQGGFFGDPFERVGFFVCFRIANKIWNVGDAKHAQLELSSRPIKDAYKFTRKRQCSVEDDGMVYLEELGRDVVIDNSIDVALNKIKIKVGEPVWARLWIWG